MNDERGHKVAGIVITIALVIVAFIIFIISQISVSKKSNSTTSDGISTTTSEVISNKVTSSKSTEQSTKKEVTQSTEDKKVNSSSDISLIKIVNEDKLDYSSASQKTSGIVESKECYLDSNQVIYLIKIKVDLGTSSQVISYYCNYNSYSQVNVNDILSVEYKQVSTSTFTILSIQK